MRSVLYLWGPWHLFLPSYTYYCSGDVQTTVDYILMDVESASMTTFSVTHELSDLSTCDHFALAISLVYSTVCRCIFSDLSDKLQDGIEHVRVGSYK